ncbi:ABC transporter ATP-binding protein/permease [Uliginosibacterium sp. sgz301328]|uniref:ABC transporter ATP-binding protein/permease n=1 Tax=Uliginosibacterium sp. sgz301328 TaxID=3243764 RepID=UPI00359CD44B
MDWTNQLADSLWWLLRTFVISLAGFAAVTYSLGKYTRWGRQIWHLAWPYFSPRRSLGPLTMLAVIIFMALFAVRMNVLFSYWYNGFYAAMQALDAKAFWFMMAVFCVLATVHVVRALLNFYVNQVLLVRWRMWLTDSLMRRWLDSRSYYRADFVTHNVDNPDQRIQQDVDSFVTSTLSLSTGLLSSVVSLVEFTIILWGLSGALSLFGIDIPRGMIFVVYIYVLVATVFAVWVGHPLVRLNFLTERFNATFRYVLIRVREYGESIAFFRGEAVELQGLRGRFADVIRNTWDIIYRSLKFQGLNLAVSQIAVVFPFLIQAPRLFTKQITLGDVMQTGQAFGQVQDALSFFRTSYDEFAGFRAVLDRLTGFVNAMDMAEALPMADISRGDALSIEALSVRTPAEHTLVSKLSLQLSRGDALLIRGRSGMGKTTLLRAVAGLWPYVDGHVERPLDEALFLPQKPYLPLGSLRAALSYPSPTPATPEHAAEVLHQCQLGHLVKRLDDEADWGRVLSLGEQQRLAIGRALIARPRLVFLDEASSAMDEGLEHAMYSLLRQALPDSIIVSVGHRSTLHAFHTHELELLGEGRWRSGALIPA